MLIPKIERQKQIEVKRVKRLFDKPLNIQKFAAPTPDQVREAVKDLDTVEKITEKLVEMGVIKETIKEIDKPITQDGVNAFLVANKEVSESIYNANVKNFLAKKFGKKEEEITEDLINEELVTKSTLTEQGSKYQEKLIEQAIENSLGGNATLLGPHIKRDLVKINDKFEITGITEEITRLKTLFPSQFIDEAEPGKGTGKGKEKTLDTLEELKKKAEETGSVMDRMNYSRALRENTTEGDL